ncbi:cation efflux protein [Cantharellus anzutake]|uniref:cation efflux protein n=1 Tax=Cantharellus anzutake TaxID=1750568 RepID=UPI001905744B|nr:cation efflux protein [Cantharellus anzutake]KAF8342608.1 cation efflux protein [Cantharellus anzutake]
MDSRSLRIWALLIIDSIFLLVELTAGYAVGSLALVADAFHMLNDVLSLVVALYAIKLSANSPTSNYSYGWHRAEILAALVNGVFLLALCLSIFLEAVERFFSVPEISNPKLVVIVGSLGLASNILGLFLFHEHGHSHGHGDSPASSPSATPKKMESSPIPSETTPLVSPPSSPKRIRGSAKRSRSPSPYTGHPAQTRARVVQTAEQAGYHSGSFSMAQSPSSPSASRGLARVYGASRAIPIPPEDAVMDDSGSDGDEHSVHEHSRPDARFHSHTSTHTHKHDPEHVHSAVDIETQGPDHGHIHSHGSMNMRALLLHVLGDALGNVGVISSGLIIWLTTWSWKYYSDPIISLVITCIIFTSALPLVKSASFILLQGVPPSISLDAVREDIEAIPGVLSLHELHVWQLSETKIVASVHVCVAHEGEEGSRAFMEVAGDIKKVLHNYEVHSSTIQPEFFTIAGHEAQSSRPGSGTVTPCRMPCAPGRNCPPEVKCCRE